MILSKTNSLLLIAFTVALFGLSPGVLQADIEFELQTIYNGDDPPIPSPWGKATFANASDGAVTLTMETYAIGATEKIQDWNFNINDETLLSGLHLSWVNALGSVQANSILVDANGVQGLGGGSEGSGFDFAFRYNPDHLVANEVSVYQLWHDSQDLTEDMFNAVNAAGLFVSAHIIGIPGNLSGAATVPEPSTIAIWSVLGLCGVGLAVRRRKK